MKTVTTTEFAENASRILEHVESGDEEIVIVRDDHPVARLIPSNAGMTVREAFGDLPGLLTDEEAEAWLRDAEGADRSLDQELRDPWE
jgi:antitoxin (DNA-binding transcriptional repressor) of toxin-antitoxin stability system